MLDNKTAKQLQAYLNNQTNAGLIVDGDFGPKSVEALKRFQFAKKLPVTGEYDATTKAVIEAVSQLNENDLLKPFETNTEQFRQLLRTTTAVANAWCQPMLNAMKKYGIITKIDAIMFLSQVGHETNGLTVLVENLNYSAQGLANTWPNRYAVYGGDKKPLKHAVDGKLNNVPNVLAKRLANNPQAIANNAYANRLGNGDEASGDGWNFRGQGPIQATGKTNIEMIGKAIGYDLITHPELLQTPEVGSLASAYFWYKNNITKLAVKNDFDSVSDEVNLGKLTEKEGDAIGYSDRYNRYQNGLTIYA